MFDTDTNPPAARTPEPAEAELRQAPDPYGDVALGVECAWPALFVD
jgi:hypothetical protein